MHRDSEEGHNLPSDAQPIQQHLPDILMLGMKKNSEHVDTERTQQVGRVRHSIKKLNKQINVEGTNQKSTMLGSEMEDENYASQRHLKSF